MISQQSADSYQLSAPGIASVTHHVYSGSLEDTLEDKNLGELPEALEDTLEDKNLGELPEALEDTLEDKNTRASSARTSGDIPRPGSPPGMTICFQANNNNLLSFNKDTALHSTRIRKWIPRGYAQGQEHSSLECENLGGHPEASGNNLSQGMTEE